MNTTFNPIDRRSVYVAAGLISGCGVLLLNVLPVFVGMLAETFGFSESQLGDIIAAYNLAFTIIAVSALVWIRRINWRLISTISALIAITAFVMMIWADNFASIISLTAFVGLGLGGLYALIMAVLGDSEDPDRAYGIKLGLETLPGAVLLFVLPILIAPNYGFAGVVLTMAAVLLLLALASFWLPGKGVKNDLQADEHTALQQQNFMLSSLSLFASLAYVSGLVATWAFLDLLGSSKGLSGDQVGSVLSIGFVLCGGGGGFAAAVIADRWGRITPMIFIIIINCIALVQLSQFTDLMSYGIGCFLFMFCINFGLAYLFGLTAVVDQTGKLVVLSAAVLSLGAMIGPMVSGRLIESHGFEAMLMFSAVCSCISLVSYLVVSLMIQKQSSVHA